MVIKYSLGVYRASLTINRVQPITLAAPQNSSGFSFNGGVLILWHESRSSYDDSSLECMYE